MSFSLYDTQDLVSAGPITISKPPGPVPGTAKIAGHEMAAVTRSTAHLFFVYFAIALVTWSVFGQTLRHRFVNYDDQNYVYENREVSAGLSWHGVIAAFTQPHAQNWHPLTTLSHMLDCQIFGLDPAGHHLNNILLHTAAALLLFSVLNGMTGALWRSAFVAILFAIHPLRAESVAWVSERKDVLSGVFFMMTLAAYVHYVRTPSLIRYLVTLMFFAFGLMAKPTVVTLPVALLLLDYWPLARFRQKDNRDVPNETGFRRHLRGIFFVEKIPFLVLSIASAAVTIAVQRHTVGYGQDLSPSWRISNALISYVTYIGQLLWPTRLAVFYPYAETATIWQVTLAALFLIAISVIAIRLRRNRPYLFVGWIWYLVGLIPVIGIIQVGLQGHADRYTYLPQIGLCIALTWTIADLGAISINRSRGLALAGLTVIAALVWQGWIQTSYWNDSETLWQHAIAVTDRNDVAHNNVAILLMKRGRLDEAISHFKAALSANPETETHNHLSPAIIENSLGNALAQKGDVSEALVHYRKAIQLRPDFWDARSNLCAMLLWKGDVVDAISEYEQIVAASPDDGPAHERIASMLMRANRPREAVAYYRRALDITPDSVNVLNALAWILATSTDSAVRNGGEAISLAERANRLSGGEDPVILRIVAASYAASGRFGEAVAIAKRAVSLAREKPPLNPSLELELARYREAALQIAASKSAELRPR